MTTDVEIYQDIVTHKYLHILATTFLYWDHIITFGRERECIWSQARTFTAQLFFLNRYLAFSANMVVIIMGFTDLNHSACHKYYLYRQISLIITQVIVCILLTMRLYALYSCSRRILCYMLCSGVILVSVSCWALFSQEHVDHDSTDHWPGCQSGLDRETATRVASPWEALFVYDTILFALTVIKTRQNQQSDIVALLLRDGAIYFAVMALANLMNILTFYLAREFLRGSLSSFASCVSVTMMSRLMLNLHATSRFQSVGTSTWMTFGRDLELTRAETDTRSMGEDEIDIEDGFDAQSTSGERVQIRLHL